MKRLLLLLIATSGFAFAGCATHRQAATVWEYEYVYGPSFQNLTTPINMLGSNGWELVTVGFDNKNGSFAALKRPKK
jgi:hypothetical protein